MATDDTGGGRIAVEMVVLREHPVDDGAVGDQGISQFVVVLVLEAVGDPVRDSGSFQDDEPVGDNHPSRVVTGLGAGHAEDDALMFLLLRNRRFQEPLPHGSQEKTEVL